MANWFVLLTSAIQKSGHSWRARCDLDAQTYKPKSLTYWALKYSYLIVSTHKSTKHMTSSSHVTRYMPLAGCVNIDLKHQNDRHKLGIRRWQLRISTSLIQHDDVTQKVENPQTISELTATPINDWMTFLPFTTCAARNAPHSHQTQPAIQKPGNIHSFLK